MPTSSKKPPKVYNARVIGVTGEGGEADIKMSLPLDHSEQAALVS